MSKFDWDSAESTVARESHTHVLYNHTATLACAIYWVPDEHTQGFKDWSLGRQVLPHVTSRATYDSAESHSNFDYG